MRKTTTKVFKLIQDIAAKRLSVLAFISSKVLKWLGRREYTMLRRFVLIIMPIQNGDMENL